MTCTYVTVPGSSTSVGTDRPVAYPADGEQPAREVRVAAFEIATTTVTIAEFAEFVEQTGYVTEAERFGTSFVFAGLLPDDAPDTRAVVGSLWWREVECATWKHPTGPWSSVDGLDDHPVTQVSWNDANAYCSWAGVRLPTELEWERAARGDAPADRDFPWGDELEPGGVHMMNVWQGEFPSRNTLADGYLGTAPVRTYPPNSLGLYEVCGNVWEFTSSRFMEHLERAQLLEPPQPADARVSIRGGSYLCHESYCHRYRLSARSSTTVDSSTGNQGFRVARDVS